MVLARDEWLERIPGIVDELQERWSLEVGSPFSNKEISAAWVAPVRGPDGSELVLKIGWPHMEADHEIAALRLLAGEPTVLLIEADEDMNAMLLERCIPGTHLRQLPEEEQDVVVTDLLRRFWRVVDDFQRFRPLSEMTAYWADEMRLKPEGWRDHELVLEGLRLFEELPHTTSDRLLLATDLHAGNILSADRRPWLVIDPKPFIGDPAYDATQHLLNCTGRLREDPIGLIGRLSDLLDVDAERVRLWTFARAAAETRSKRHWEAMFDLARKLAP